MSTNKACAICRAGRNTFNGRYCTLLRRSVEYAKQPPCESENTEI